MNNLFSGLLLSLVTAVLALSTFVNAEVPSGQLAAEVEPTHYHVKLKVDPEQDRFSGESVIQIKIKKPSRHFYLHAQDMEIRLTEIEADKGKLITAVTEKTDVEGVIKVSAQQLLGEGSYSVKFVYDSPFDENLQGLYRVKDGDQHYAFSQMQSIYARLAFPSFDEPRFKTKFDITMVVPQKLTAITNAPEVKTTSLSDGWKQVEFMTSKPMPTYLVAFAVGEFDVVEWQDLPVTKVRKTALPLRGIATKGKGGKLKYALENTREITEALEDYFQTPYPYRKLDILAVPDFAAGAMENPGAITYREQLLLLDEKSSISQKRSYKSIHAHELAHQWFGNLVTPIWWNDIWLNEAFATWMAATALHRKWPDDQWRRSQIRSSKRAMNSDSIPSARKVRNPIKSNGDIITAFDGITYSKGGGVLSMVESFMGEEAFRKGVQKHMHKYRWGNADAIDFFESIASVLEPDRAAMVVKSFRNFVEQSGVPLLDISQQCDDERTELTVSQKRFAPLGTKFKEKTLWNIPACMSYEVDGAIQQQCQVLSKPVEKVTLKYQGCADWVLPNTAAAGYYRFNMDQKGWKQLLSNLDKVDAPEANAVLDSMRSSFDSGNIALADLIKVIPSTLDSRSWEVVVSGMATFRTVLAYAEESEKEAIRKLGRDVYRDKTNTLGLDNNTDYDKEKPLDASSLRSGLVGFMGGAARDKTYRNELLNRAKLYIGYKKDGKLNEEALIPSLATLGMAVAVQELGQEYVDAVITHLRNSNDGTIRGRLLGALGATEDPEIAKQLLKLTAEKLLRDNEKFRLLFSLNGEEKLDGIMWPWLQANFDKLVEDMPTNYKSYTPYLFATHCKKESYDRLESFLKPRLSKLTGAGATYPKAKDYLDQCMAQKSHLKPQITQLVKTLGK